MPFFELTRIDVLVVIYVHIYYMQSLSLDYSLVYKALSMNVGISLWGYDTYYMNRHIALLFRVGAYLVY